VDNRDNTTEKKFERVSGQWASSSLLKGRYGQDYAYTTAGSGVETARARFDCSNLPSGAYAVYAWWPANKDRAANVPFEIYHAGGVAGVRVNQTMNGGQWVFLGVFNFVAGQHRVEIHNGQSEPGKFVCADAVRFVRTAAR